MNSITQDGWKYERLMDYWHHEDIPGWVVEVGKGPITLTTPEGELVTDRFGDPWQFQSLEDAYQFVIRANLDGA